MIFLWHDTWGSVTSCKLKREGLIVEVIMDRKEKKKMNTWSQKLWTEGSNLWYSVNIVVKFGWLITISHECGSKSKLKSSPNLLKYCPKLLIFKPAYRCVANLCVMQIQLDPFKSSNYLPHANKINNEHAVH